MAEKSSLLKEREMAKKKMHQQADALHKYGNGTLDLICARTHNLLFRELDKLEQSLLRTQAAIDKKQNGVDVKLKIKAQVRKKTRLHSIQLCIKKSCFQLQERRESGSLPPLEADIERVGGEIRATVEYCNEAKAK